MDSCCPYCGEAAHTAPLACPRIKSITYRADGSIVRVEMHAERQSWRIGDAFTEVSGARVIRLGGVDSSSPEYGRITN